MTTQKQKDQAIKRTFSALEKIGKRKDNLGYNPYKGIYYFNDCFYVNDSVCMVKVKYYKEIELPNKENNTYYKVNVINEINQIRPLFNLCQDEQTEKMDAYRKRSNELVFDRFFNLDKVTDEIIIDPKRLNELLNLFSINKITPSITYDKHMLELKGFNNDYCLVEAVLMGIRNE